MKRKLTKKQRKKNSIRFQKEQLNTCGDCQLYWKAKCIDDGGHRYHNQTACKMFVRYEGIEE